MRAVAAYSTCKAVGQKAPGSSPPLELSAFERRCCFEQNGGLETAAPWQIAARIERRYSHADES